MSKSTEEHSVYVLGRTTGVVDGDGFVEVEFDDRDTGNGYHYAFVHPKRIRYTKPKARGHKPTEHPRGGTCKMQHPQGSERGTCPCANPGQCPLGGAR